MNRITLLLGLLAVGCSPPSAPQVVTGHVEQTNFPAHVDGVRVVQGTRVVVSAPVADDGSFSITIPAGAGYHVQFVSIGEPDLVFPRQTGAIETAFTIHTGTTPFDLGMVRYIGDSSARTYHQGSSTSGDDVECEDGLDPNGAVCVDDDGDQTGSCEDGANDGETNDDGVDQGDGDGETDDDGPPPSNAAVAEHNLPSSIGCDGEEQDD